MLHKDDFTQIGFVGRTHGVHGEVACKLSVDLSQLLDEDGRIFLMLEEQELLIPYAIEEHRNKAGDIDLIRFAGIMTKESAESLTNMPIWMSNDYLGEKEISDDPYDFARYVGFTLINSTDDMIVGTITDVDESTINTLLFVQTESGDEIIIPIADELIQGYNDTQRLLSLIIPQGLLDDSAVYDTD